MEIYILYCDTSDGNDSESWNTFYVQSWAFSSPEKVEKKKEELINQFPKCDPDEMFHQVTLTLDKNNPYA